MMIIMMVMTIMMAMKTLTMTYFCHRWLIHRDDNDSSERPSHDVHIQWKTSHCQYSTRPARLVLCRCHSSGPYTDRISCVYNMSFHYVLQTRRRATKGCRFMGISANIFIPLCLRRKRAVEPFTTTASTVNRFWKFFTVGNSDELSTKYNVASNFLHHVFFEAQCILVYFC